MWGEIHPSAKQGLTKWRTNIQNLGLKLKKLKCWGQTYYMGTKIQSGGLTLKSGINLNEGTNNGTTGHTHS